MRIIDKYICKTVLQFTLISLLVLLGLFTLVNFLDQLSKIGQGNYNLLHVFEYLLLRTPRLVYDLFPMAALLGTIIGLSVLASDSELIVLRASGMSIAQITISVLKMGSVFVLAVILIGELVAPFTETKAQYQREQALQNDIGKHGDFGLWLRDDDLYINIDEVLPDLTLSGMTIMEFDQDKKLRSLVSANRGQYIDSGWYLGDVKQTLFFPNGDIDTVDADTAQWQSKLTPKILSAFLVSTDQLSVLQLAYYINHLKANQQQATRYELALWHKLMSPLSIAVMIILAIPFVFTNLRSGALGRNVFIGIMLGISFYAINQGFGYVVLAQGFSPLFGATFPMIVFLLLAILMIRFTK